MKGLLPLPAVAAMIFTYPRTVPFPNGRIKYLLRLFLMRLTLWLLRKNGVFLTATVLIDDRALFGSSSPQFTATEKAIGTGLAKKDENKISPPLQRKHFFRLLGSLQNSKTTYNVEDTFATIWGYGGSKASYLYGSNGICRGIIQDIYVDHSWSRTAQIDAEKALTRKISRLPAWLSSDCFSAILRYYCSTTYLRPEKKALQIDVNVTSRTWSYAYTTGEGSIHGDDKNLADSDISVARFNFTFYAPSYPHRSVCDDYVAKCSTAVELLSSLNKYKSKDPSVLPATLDALPDCTEVVQQSQTTSSSQSSGMVYDDGMVSTGYSGEVAHCLFPSANQTVLNLNLTIEYRNGSKTTASGSSAQSGAAAGESAVLWSIGPSAIPVATSPNKLMSTNTAAAAVGTRTKSAADEYVTECPQGYVVPDDPTHPRNKWLAGTGCAEACRLGDD
jgi:hypothetical protein